MIIVIEGFIKLTAGILHALGKNDEHHMYVLHRIGSVIIQTIVRCHLVPYGCMYLAESEVAAVRADSIRIDALLCLGYCQNELI